MARRLLKSFLNETLIAPKAVNPTRQNDLSMNSPNVTCDACGADLTSTTNIEDYRMVLCSERKWSEGGSVTLMHIEPELSRAHHFCATTCLRAWLGRTKREANSPQRVWDMVEL